MRPFAYDRVATPDAAVAAAAAHANGVTADAPTRFVAGGTTLLDLMKLDVMRPERLVDINALKLDAIAIRDGALHLGALARMAHVADHADVRANFPVIAEALELAASGQIRNMASLGGNVLQRTRCSYFRDPTIAECNKRSPGSGCAALGGMNRMHAVLGASDACIATYPGDFAQALIALDAEVEILGPDGPRKIPFATLHVRPDADPQIETTLEPGELITGFRVPASAWAKRSTYVKVRDRESYAYALASAAVALEMDGATVTSARIALGGVATTPWRAREAEAALAGKTLDAQSARAAADIAFAGATPRDHNAYKAALGRETVVRALLKAASLEA
jgi:xanthine dehydrogenase YagS FAD-binding subunit